MATLRLSLAALLVGSLTASAQERPPAPGGFEESIDVRVVDVEAVVTDERGRPVTQRALQAGSMLLIGGSSLDEL